MTDLTDDDNASDDSVGVPMPDLVVLLEATDGEYLPIRRTRVVRMPDGLIVRISETCAVELRNGTPVMKGSEAEVVAAARDYNRGIESASGVEKTRTDSLPSSLSAAAAAINRIAPQGTRPDVLDRSPETSDFKQRQPK